MAVQSIVLTGARVLGFAAAFIIPIVLVRLFSQEDFGTYKGAFLIAQTAVQVLGFGLPASIFFFLPRDRHDGHRYLAQGVILLALAGALGAMALFVAGPTLVRLMGAPGLLAVLPWLALLLLVDAPSSLAHTVPIADQRAVLAGTVVVSSDILRATALIAAALLFRSVGAVVAAAALIGMLRVAFLLGYMGFRRIPGSPGISWASIKEQLAYALPFWSALLLQVGSRRTHAYYVMAA
ncbi:MAG: oligosaccharide flippase family protein, partial [Gemmatimonadetes bacterium]|nr:oligosaccharide flippase family protein [Gemmatimonadota bacterium]